MVWLGALRGLAQRHELRALGEALEGALLDLTGPLGRDAELATGLAERLGLLVAGAEAHLDDVALRSGELLDRGQQRLGAEGLVDLLVDRRGLQREQIAERGVPVVADRLVEAHDGAIRLADLDDVGQRQVGSGGDLLVARLVAELRRQLTLDAPDLPGALRHVNGEPDRPARVLEAALDGLADPERRVGGEAEALAPVELLDRADETQHALLDEIAERETLTLVAPVLGVEVTLLDALRQLDLLAGLEQRVAARLAQEELQGVHRGVGDRLALVLPGARGIGDGGRCKSFRHSNNQLFQ